jgi:hypothetical protein
MVTDANVNKDNNLDLVDKLGLVRNHMYTLLKCAVVQSS